MLPDTCAWIDFFRGARTPLAEALGQALVGGEVLTCGVVLCELLQGIKTPREEKLVHDALLALPHLEMTRALWVTAGKLAARLRAAGHSLPLSDIIIAVLALDQQCAVLTIDRHFAAIPKLQTLKGLP
jgi:predicted nucleic acid-binding protein